MSGSSAFHDIAAHFAQANRVLVCVPLITDENFTYVTTLYSILSTGDKTVHLVSPNAPKPELANRLQVSNITLRNKIPGDKYTITIDYNDADVDKVSWDNDEERNRLIYYIHTQSGDFDFSNVKFGELPSEYDLIALVDLKNYDQLGELYTASKELCDGSKKVALRKSSTDIGDVRYLTDTETADSEFLLYLANAVGVQDGVFAKQIFHGIDWNIIRADKQRYSEVLTMAIEMGVDPVDILPCAPTEAPATTEDTVDSSPINVDDEETQAGSDSVENPTEGSTPETVPVMEAKSTEQTSHGTLELKLLAMVASHTEVSGDGNALDIQLGKKLLSEQGLELDQKTAKKILRKLKSDKQTYKVGLITVVDDADSKNTSADVYVLSYEPDAYDADLLAQVYESMGTSEFASFRLENLTSNNVRAEIRDVMHDLYSIQYDDFTAIV